jgi:hypothetical protein
MFASRVAAPRTRPSPNPVHAPARGRVDRAPCTAGRSVPWDFGAVAIAVPGLPPTLQAKLTVGPVDDPLEREADRVAERVMRMPDPDRTLAIGPVRLSRQCAACDEEDRLMRRTGPGVNAGPDAVVAPDLVHNVLAGPGQPIDRASRDFFEPRIGRDLSAVRVHLGAAAATSARAVGAHAYTVGSRIVFAAGAYAPESEVGKRLLAHELAHVVQQNPHLPNMGGLGSVPARLPEVTAASPGVLARQPALGHCGGAWTCATSPACEQPDTPGSGAASTNWQLELNIDTDVPESTDIAAAADVGHTYVVFSESNGARYSYGFYPNPATKPTDFASRVFGCVVHPDTTHKPCIDYTKAYTLTQPQYDKGLQFAQLLCKAPPNYDLFNWNCTTASVTIAQQAGQTPPAAKGKVAHGTATADNPNTLKAGYLDQDVPTRHLQSDTDIRDWASAHSAADVTPLPSGEKVRLLNRLLNGWVSDDDVAAFEKICSGITAATERKSVQDQVGRRENDLHNNKQKARVHTALFGP